VTDCILHGRIRFTLGALRSVFFSY
jgi:hypothetical protein